MCQNTEEYVFNLYHRSLVCFPWTASSLHRRNSRSSLGVFKLFFRISQSLGVGLRKSGCSDNPLAAHGEPLLSRTHLEPCPVPTQQSEPSPTFSCSWIALFTDLPALCLVLDNTGKVIYYEHAVEIQGQGVKMKLGCIFQIEVRLFIIDYLILSRCLLLVFL